MIRKMKTKGAFHEHVIVAHQAEPMLASRQYSYPLEETNCRNNAPSCMGCSDSGLSRGSALLSVGSDIRQNLFSVTSSCFRLLSYQFGHLAERKKALSPQYLRNPLMDISPFEWLMFCPVSTPEPIMWQRTKNAWVTFPSLEPVVGTTPPTLAHT